MPSGNTHLQTMKSLTVCKKNDELLSLLDESERKKREQKDENDMAIDRLKGEFEELKKLQDRLISELQEKNSSIKEMTDNISQLIKNLQEGENTMSQLRNGIQNETTRIEIREQQGKIDKLTTR